MTQRQTGAEENRQPRKQPQVPPLRYGMTTNMRYGMMSNMWYGMTTNMRYGMTKSMTASPINTQVTSRHASRGWILEDRLGVGDCERWGSVVGLRYS